MQQLHKKWFSREGILTLELAKSIAASDNAAINVILGRCCWQGAQGAGVATELTPDNRHVARAFFFLHGSLLDQPATVAAHKLWERADKAVTVSLTFPAGDTFSFQNGSHASDYVPADAFKFACSKNGEVILPTDYATHGIGDLCLRAVAYLDKASNSAQGPKTKFTVLGYPTTGEEMMEMTDLAADVGWPGVKLLEGIAEFTLLALIEGWGCPFLPVLLPATDLTTFPNIPAGAELRFAMAKVMATARLPVPCTAAAPMQKRWDKLLQDPNSLEERMPTVTWPVPPQPQLAGSGGVVRS